MPARRSLRFQLLAGLLVPLGVVALVQFAVAYRNAEATAAAVTDRILLASARSIAEHIGFESSGLDVTVPPAALGMFDLGYGDTVYYRVTGTRGKLLAGYADLPPAPGTVVAAQPAYFDAIYRGERIRLIAVAQPIALARGVQQATVVVAQTLNGQRATSRQLWLGSALEQSLLIAIACGLAWLALRRVLRPLVHLGREVEDRSPNDLRPFSVAALQAELDPLMRALNAYMLRLGAQLDAQRRFTANAAHQMRTPLTLLRTQASYALRAGNEHERQEAIRAIVATTRQITRLTNQLLSLAKAEPQGHPPQRDPLDLVAVTHDILVEHGSLAVERNIDLAFEVAPSDDTAALVDADPALLRDLIVNLVDNAVRYTPAGGTVTVSARREDDGSAVLRVEDTGPGIPAAQRALVFERFYRVPGNEADGSGLGLAIVKEIADAHHATVTLGAGASGGLVVEVRWLPAAESGADVGEGGRPPLEEPVLGVR
ncbi:MAG TPA: sensor histidine kinase N-terminal domain-containing protein [Candidatus Elarobacter sp.]